MKRSVPMITAAILALAAAPALAAGHGGGPNSSQMSGAQSQSQPSSTQPASTRGPSQTGQPSQDCANYPSTPGNSASAPGSAFNPNGNAGTKYAGQQPQNSNNSASVSQYDVACSHQPH